MAVKLTEAQIKLVVQEAFYSAYQATIKYQKENPDFYPCGFSTVTITPARGAVVKYLKDNGIGYKGYYGGWIISNPSNVPTQQMLAMHEGSKAFVEVLKSKFNININAECRID